jgi:hypothetical protein
MAFPLPSLLTKGKPAWQVQPSTTAARVNLKDRRMFVPIGLTQQERNVRAHEMGHVKWTPKTAKFPTDIDPLVCQAVEDYRINSKLRAAGVSNSLDGGVPDKIIQGAMVTAIDSLRLLTVLLTADLCGQGEHSQCRRHYPPETMRTEEQCDIIERAEYLTKQVGQFMHCRKLPKLPAAPDGTGRTIPYPFGKSRQMSFSRTIQVARWLDEMINIPPANDDDDELPNESMGTETADEKLNAGLTADWGTIKEIQHPVLVTDKKSGRNIKNSDEGSCLRAPWRVTTDQRIFRAANKAKKSGSVLIDGSGSMQLDSEQVRDFVKAAPLSTVAAYQGRKTTGILRILAKSGKTAGHESDYTFGGCNVIDGPALNWLGQQAHPRIWVCDGIVTGKHDLPSAACRADADALMARYHIKRFNTCKAALDYLAQHKGRPYQTVGTK